MADQNDKAEANRGHRPSFGPNGEVRGSGAGAGPGGNAEDHDAQPAASTAPTTPGQAEGDNETPPPNEGSPSG